eukprot:gene2574-3188_t
MSFNYSSTVSGGSSLGSGIGSTIGSSSSNQSTTSKQPSSSSLYPQFQPQQQQPQPQQLSTYQSSQSQTTSLNASSSENKQYIPSRIFSQSERSSDDVRSQSNLNSPPHGSGVGVGGGSGTPMNMSSPNTILSNTPGTPYNMYQRSTRSFYGDGGTPFGNSSIALDSMYSQQQQQRRMQLSSMSSPLYTSTTSLNQQQQSTINEKNYIPTNSIYDEPPPKPSQQSQQSNLHSQFLYQHQPLPQPLHIQQQQQLQQLQQQQQQSMMSSNSPLTTQELNVNMLSTSPSNQATSPFYNTSTTNAIVQSNTVGSNYYTPSIVDSQLYSDKYDKRWLTIFGFNQSYAEVIVDELSKYGTILETSFPPQSNANWIYVKFDSEYIANDLLKKNGIIIGNFMIGISPYKEKIKIDSDPITQPNPQSYQMIEKKYAPARNDYDPQSYNNITNNTPSRPSLMSKISEYVFGI